MTATATPSRRITDARRSQGFRSQAHLDAFFAHLDHTRSCERCQRPGAPMPLDDGLQPTAATCAVEQRLFAESCAENFERDPRGWDDYIAAARSHAEAMDRFEEAIASGADVPALLAMQSARSQRFGV